MGPFSTDEKSDKPCSVFHPVDDRVDRLPREQDPGNPSTFFDRKGKMDLMIREKSPFTALCKEKNNLLAQQI